MIIPIDLLIEARWIIPVEPATCVLENHAVAVDKGRIIAIIPQTEAASRFLPQQTKKLPSHILTPGLVNLHTHAPMTLFRGMADDLSLMDWLQNHIWPAEKKHVSAEFVYDGTRLACAEMLKGGITCFNDMYFYPRASARAALSMSMRAVIGLTVIDSATGYGTDADDYLDKGMHVYDEFCDKSDDDALLSFAIAPHAPYTVSDRSFARVLSLSKQYALPIHIHLHETASEIDDSLKIYGMRPIERLHRLGLLSPGLIAVHSVHLNANDQALLAANGCSVAHCPSSNLKLACGIAPITALVEQGVNVGLGTDGAASNNRLDILQEMRLAALLAKGNSGHAAALNAHQALRMATLCGAKALGLDDQIGSIEPGKSADLCAFQVNDVCLSLCYNPASLIAYSIGREHVSDVWIKGKCCIADSRFPQTDEIELIKLAALWQNRIRPRDI